MKRLTNEEINDLAFKFLELKALAEKSNKEEDLKEFKRFQNIFFTKLRFLVLKCVAKYKQFSNYPDLEQDGFEALLMSLNSYDPTKEVPFGYWASRYIKTKVSRSANAHSTIRVPIKKAHEMKPFKASSFPVMIDLSKDPLEKVSESETKISLNEAVNLLPKDQQKIINLTYGLNGYSSHKADDIIEHLSISRPLYNKLLSKAKNNLKKQLNDEE